MAALLEIVELDDGQVALQRADGEGEPLVAIRFSDEASEYLREARVDIARAMINTGIQIVGQITESLVEEKELDEDAVPSVLH